MLYAPDKLDRGIGKKDSDNVKVLVSSNISKVGVNIQLLDFWNMISKTN